MDIVGAIQYVLVNVLAKQWLDNDLIEDIEIDSTCDIRQGDSGSQD